MSLPAAYLGEVLSCLESERDSTAYRATQTSYSALLARIRADDHDAFETLLVEMARPLEAYARRFSESRDAAKDLVQDVFAHLWEQRHALAVHGSVKAYLYATVRNRAIDIRRRMQAETARWTAASSDGAPAGMALGSYDADRDIERREIASRVNAALATLSPRVREVATLRWANGLSREEIAEVMGVAVSTVKNQLAHAAQIVRVLLADLRDPGNL